MGSRRLIEDWFRQFPQSQRNEWLPRFRSGSDADFTSAFQELFLCEFLRRQRCKIEFHPSLTGSTKKPDFLVQAEREHGFILEACTTTEITSGLDGNRRFNRVRDFLINLPLDRYQLGIVELSLGTRDLPQKPLKHHIMTSLTTSPADSKGVIVIPSYSTPDGWRISLIAYPNGSDNPRSSTVLYESRDKVWTGPAYPIRDSLLEKAHRYGNGFTTPFVIAINSQDSMLTRRDVEEILFGVRPDVNIAGMTHELSRGFWGTEERPRSRRVSAVLFTKSLWPQTVLSGHVEVGLYLNPWAERPYNGILTKLPTFRFDNDGLREHRGMEWHELMRLHRPKSSSF